MSCLLQTQESLICSSVPIMVWLLAPLVVRCHLRGCSGSLPAYMRPETAQGALPVSFFADMICTVVGVFVNFPQLMHSQRGRLPLGMNLELDCSIDD